MRLTPPPYMEIGNEGYGITMRYCRLKEPTDAVAMGDRRIPEIVLTVKYEKAVQARDKRILFS